MTTFPEFLESKKINSSLFHEHDPARWQEWESLFEQVHPKSFTMQKLNLINQVRRKFPLENEQK